MGTDIFRNEFMSREKDRNYNEWLIKQWHPVTSNTTMEINNHQHQIFLSILDVILIPRSKKNENMIELRRYKLRLKEFRLFIYIYI